jgi:hypothetical protein
MVLLLGVWTFVNAQTCPNIGTISGAVWTGESTTISLCSPYDAETIPAFPTSETKLRQTTTTYYQEPGSCSFTAYRTVTAQSIDNGSTWTPSVPVENTWYTGTITKNGRHMSMQAQPTLYRPSYIVHGKITNVNKKTKTAIEISFITHTSTGEAGISSTVPKCAYSTWGTSTRN